MSSLRIAMVVHGRFHIFDLARELLRLGHDVTVFTNYPARTAARFGIPTGRVRSFVTHGLATRAAWRLAPACARGLLERAGNTLFGRWAARQVCRGCWDVAVSMSGVALDLFSRLAPTRTLRVLHRGSAHIRAQRRLLDEEAARAGSWIERPTDWIVAREEQEYQLADAIHTLSTFAERSFLAHSVPADKLYPLRLGVRTRDFLAPPEVLEARCRRLQDGAPITVLNVGTFSLQKGALDFLAVVEALAGGPFSFRHVGLVTPDAAALRRRIGSRADFVGKRPQAQLPAEYARGDLFFLPTIQDGFAAVLTQALAAGLPLLTTPHCGGPELIRDGEQGWIVPVRDPAAVVARLRWCDAHRPQLAAMARAAHAAAADHDWRETARQFERNVTRALARRPDRARLDPALSGRAP